MPDYRMNINGQLGLSEYSNIFDYNEPCRY